MSENKSLRDLIDELQVAETNLREASERENAARSHRTTCINEVNRLQKEIDKKYQQMRNVSSIESDWGNERREKRSVTA